MVDTALTNVSVDCVLFSFEEKVLKVLLIKRDKEPAFGAWSLPGGVIEEKEHINCAANRVLEGLTGMTDIFLDQVATFGTPDRFPETRIISILYYALIRPNRDKLSAGMHASETQWFPIDKIPELPFDHAEMIRQSLRALQMSISYRPVGFQLLPPKFPLNQLQQLYEAILDKKFDNRNFRKKVLKLGIVKRLDEKTQGMAQRPAFLYSFNKEVTFSSIL